MSEQRTMDARLRPVCQGCGHKDTATVTRAQLDVYDFQCPDCNGIYFRFVPVSVHSVRKQKDD